MSTLNEIMAIRIKERLGDLGISARSASVTATGKPDAIRSILNGVMPSAERLDQIASALNTTTAYLLGSDVPADLSEFEDRYEDDDPRLEVGRVALSRQGRDLPPPIGSAIAGGQNGRRGTGPTSELPVYSTAVAPGNALVAADGTEVEQIYVSSREIVDYLPLPPSLSRMRKVYGLYIPGFSMEPVHEPGSLVLAEPTRPPQARDIVVIYLRSEDDSSGARVLIKRLLRRTATSLELEEYNPPRTFSIDSAEVREIHRVLTLKDILAG